MPDNHREQVGIRLREFREQLGLSQKVFVENTGLEQPHLSQIQKGVRGITNEVLKNISIKYNLNINWLLAGEGGMFLNRDELSPVIIQEEKGDQFKEIPFYDTEVYATASEVMGDTPVLKPEAFIRIPQFSQGEMAVPVTGHSMKGYINHGDWAVIRQIHDVNRIIYGECYMVITRANNLRTIKFVNRHEDDTLFILSPYNTDQFTNQEVEKEDIYKMFEVIGIIRKIGS